MNHEQSEAKGKATQSLSFRLRVVEAKHRVLDERVAALGRRGYLTGDEQRELTDLKRQKLRAKDEISSIQRALR